MKKTFFILVIMLAVGMAASAQQSLIKQFKGKEGYSCVTIGKAAMKMMSNKGTLGREGFSGKLNIGNFADKMDRLEIISASTSQATEELARECMNWIESDNFESVIDVNEQGNQASIYAKTDSGGNNVFLLLAQDKETSVIIIYGSMTLEDLQGFTGGKQ